MQEDIHIQRTLNMSFNLQHDIDDDAGVVVDARADADDVVDVDYLVLNLNHAKLELLAMVVVAKCWVAKVIERQPSDVVMNQLLDKLTVL